MELINKYNGAVFFVDILGISALTQGTLKLQDPEYAPWLEDHGIPYTDQHMAAAILAEFRQILISLDLEFPNITITQLSDCAFAWSKDISDIILFAAKFMNTAIRSGILCRGGMSYGEIIETNQPHTLGRFIVGKAVTKAATLERAPKGARILIDQDLPVELYNQDPDFSEKFSELFSPFTNPLDYTVYDEFMWYLCPDLNLEMEGLSILSFKERVALTKSRLKQGAYIRHSPRFNWNLSSPQGTIHAVATINFIARSYLLNVHHNFEWESLSNLRSNKNLEGLIKKIETYPDYREWTEPQIEDWAD